MSYRISISGPAVADIKETVGYIANEMKNPKAADEHLRGFMDTIRSLEEMPKRYQLSDDSELRELGIRFVSFRNFLIAYSVIDDENVVEVYRILYSRSDLKQKLI
ncbi:MAG: type II toxin-antitoxin system RelE/ParE family toxin [Candidatus Methanomethylophilaceae archaeon]|nr:type II toxin-antitoxin system RelE/ParE family toxin [Candidatus Methanomethylophilaceae archaeon]